MRLFFYVSLFFIFPQDPCHLCKSKRIPQTSCWNKRSACIGKLKSVFASRQKTTKVLLIYLKLLATIISSNSN